MLDTNMCIYVLKNRTNKLKHKFKVSKYIYISSITYAELCFGIENGEPSLRKQRWKELKLFTQKLLIEPLGEDAAKEYGLIRATLKKQGNLIGNNDILIAAHARSLNMILVTNNTDEFKRVTNLEIENWV
jgi:tRNA(fMet)-specific endonuclease VapC